VELVHEFDLTAELAPAVAVGPGPYGERRIREVRGVSSRGAVRK
jgi:hypothetical protein